MYFDITSIKIESFNIAETPSALELPALEKLDLELRANAMSMEKLLPIMSAPNLKNLHIVLYFSDDNDARDQIEVLFPLGTPRWPKLETLDVMIFTWDLIEDNAQESPLNALFSRLPPSLRRLVVSSDLPQPRNFWICEDFRYDGGPGYSKSFLQEMNICFRRDQLDASFLLGVREVLYSLEFEMLEMRGCYVDTELIKERLPEFEYIWLGDEPLEV